MPGTFRGNNIAGGAKVYERCLARVVWGVGDHSGAEEAHTKGVSALRWSTGAEHKSPIYGTMGGNQCRACIVFSHVAPMTLSE